MGHVPVNELVSEARAIAKRAAALGTTLRTLASAADMLAGEIANHADHVESLHNDEID